MRACEALTVPFGAPKVPKLFLFESCLAVSFLESGFQSKESSRSLLAVFEAEKPPRLFAELAPEPAPNLFKADLLEATVFF